MKVDKNFMIAERWYLRLVVQLQSIKAAFAGHRPLLRSRRCHSGVQLVQESIVLSTIGGV